MTENKSPSEIPTDVRKMTEQSMQQVRTAIDSHLQFFQRAVPGNVMGGNELSNKVLNYAERNVHQSASSMPPATAGPFMAAMTGFDSSSLVGPRDPAVRRHRPENQGPKRIVSLEASHIFQVPSCTERPAFAPSTATSAVASASKHWNAATARPRLPGPSRYGPRDGCGSRSRRDPTSRHVRP